MEDEQYKHPDYNPHYYWCYPKICKGPMYYDNTIPKADFIKDCYDEWMKGKQPTIEPQTETEDETNLGPGHRFTLGDVTPKQNYSTFERYMIPEVPPEEYLTNKQEQMNIDPESYFKGLVNIQTTTIYRR